MNYQRQLSRTIVVWILLAPAVAVADEAPVEQLPFTVFAAQQTSETDSPVSEDAFADSSYLTPHDLQGLAKRVTIFALMVVLACGAIVVFANKRVSRNVDDAGQLHVVETISLAPRCFCDLVKVRGKFFVVARDATGLKEMRQVGDFSDAFTEFASDEPTDATEEYANGSVFDR